MVEVMKVMVTSLKSPHSQTATPDVPNPTAGHCWPTPRWRLLGTQGQVWASLLWGHCSFLLHPGVQGSVCALQESFPQSCVSSGSSVVGLMVTPPGGLKPYPGPLHPEPLPLRQATADPSLHRRCSKTVCLSLCGVPGSCCTQGWLEPSERLWGAWGLILNMISPLLPSYWDVSVLGRGVSPHSHSRATVSCNLTITAY